MQMLVHSEKDVQFLNGKFVLQVDTHRPDDTLMSIGWDFAKDKRLYLVLGYSLTTLYGDTRDYKTLERFKNYFNHYLFDHTISEGKTDGGRFHRLLTDKELDYLASKLKEENY